jgi:NAD-dependent dihydropyrimidine dehydrogenase PreA subunit
MAAEIHPDLCTGCRACIPLCPVEAIYIEDGIAKVISQFCHGCGYCADGCGEEAITIISDD